MSTRDLNSIKESSVVQPISSGEIVAKSGNKALDENVKVAVISSTPTPYRDKVYDMIAEKMGNRFKVYYCGSKEPIREWKLKKLNHNHLFLKGWNIRKRGGWSFVYFNFDIWKYLIKDRPEVVITTGFNPTHLFGWMYCLLFRKSHVPFTDTWAHADSVLTVIHQIVRKLVFSTSKAFIGPGQRTSELYQSYGVNPKKFFQSHLAADTEIYNENKPFHERPYDLMFAGQLHIRKSPLFFVDIAKKLKERFPTIRVLILGSGPMEEAMSTKLSESGVDYYFPGFIQPDNLPHYYASSKLFLFPTKLDAWGVVANEALASGTPVLVTPFAGAAYDLVQEGKNGYILDLDLDQWVEKITFLFENPNEWQKLSMKGLTSKNEYTYENAAKGILKAWEYLKKKKQK